MPKKQSSITVNPSSTLLVLGSATFDTVIEDVPPNRPVGIVMNCFQGTALIFSWAGALDATFPFGSTVPHCDDQVPPVCHGWGYDNFDGAHVVAQITYWRNPTNQVFVASCEFEVAAIPTPA